MTTLKVFDVDGTRGLAGLYTIDSSNPDNDAPLVNPYGHLPDVQWHSQFRYPRVIIDQAATVTIPAGVANKVTVSTIDLFAHGRTGGVPMLGPCALLIPTPSGGTQWVPLTATTPMSFAETVGGVPVVNVRPGNIISPGANATYARLVSCRQGAGSSYSATVRITILDQYL